MPFPSASTSLIISCNSASVRFCSKDLTQTETGPLCAIAVRLLVLAESLALHHDDVHTVRLQGHFLRGLLLLAGSLFLVAFSSWWPLLPDRFCADLSLLPSGAVSATTLLFQHSSYSDSVPRCFALRLLLCWEYCSLRHLLTANSQRSSAPHA